MAAHERRHFRVLLAAILLTVFHCLHVGSASPTSIPLGSEGLKMGSLRFDPPRMEFPDELTCVAHTEKVNIYCDGCFDFLNVESASSDVLEIIPALAPRSGVKTNKKKGKSPIIAVLHVMFIAQQPGEIYGKIAVSTTAGVINYEVSGTAKPNSYGLEPVVHSRAIGGEVMHHPVSVFNPFNDVMQVTQVSTNDTFIQLLAPGEFRPVGQKRTPAGSSRILPERAGAAWTINPQETSIVGYAKFSLPPGKYRGFINLKLDRDPSRILIPVSLGVMKVTGVKITPDIVDFQTLVSSVQARSIWLSVTNMNSQPIQLLSLFDPTQNPNLQISGFDHKKGISVAPESTMRFAKVTYHGSREGALHGKLQLIVNDTDAVSATLAVPYKANVLYGPLGFMNDKTKFLATPGRVTSTMRAIMVSNNFSVPILIRSAKIDDPSFKISHFQPDTVLQPGEAASLMHLEYTSHGTSALCTRDLELATNVTAMKIPLQVYHGNLHCQIEHGPLQECSAAANSLDLNMGILSVSEARRSRLNITNLNPVNVTIEGFSFSHPSVSLHMDGIFTPQGIQTRGSRPIPKQSNTKKVLTLQAGHRLALTLEVLEKEPTVAGGPPVNASVQLLTKRGEKITIRIRYESVLGGLSFSPASLRFDASFPGQVQSRVVAARSTFEQPLQLNAVRSTDSRIIPELLTKTLKPLARTEVVRVYYDPAKATSVPGAGTAEDSARELFAASESGETVHWNTPLTLDFLERWMARQKSVTNSNGRGTSEIEAMLIFDTHIVLGATLQVQASLMQPHALFEPMLAFDLTQVGASKARWLLAQNPSDSTLALQLVFPVCADQAAKSRSSLLQQNLTTSTALQDGSGSPSLAADCEGGRAFHLGPEAEGKIWHVEPYGEASIGPIIFEPFQHAQFRTTLYLRNNLTTLHPVELNGHGGSSRLVFPDGILEFNLTISDFAEEGKDASGLQGISNLRLNESDDLYAESKPGWLSWMTTANQTSESGLGEGDDKASKPWWRQRRLAVTRSIVATNDCELPVEVAQVNIGGIPGCSAFGFEVRDCQLPLTVAPHESVAFMVSFTPEVVASRWAQNLRFLSASGRLVLQVPLEVNLQPELLPMLSDLPTSLQILGDQTEASLRKAVVGTAFTVLVMMLAVVAMDSFRAWKAPVAPGHLSKLLNGSASETSTAARIGEVISMLSWTSIDTLAGVQEKEPSRHEDAGQPQPAQQPQVAPAQQTTSQQPQAQLASRADVSQSEQLKEQQQQLQQQLQQLQQLQQQHLQQHLQQQMRPETQGGGSQGGQAAKAQAKSQPKAQPVSKSQPQAKAQPQPKAQKNGKNQKEQSVQSTPSAKAAASAGHAAAKSPPPASSQTVVERRPSQSLKEDAKTKKKEKDVAKDAAKETEHSPQAKAPALKRQEEEEERKREERREREEDRRREEEAKKEKKERLSAEETGKKKESKAKAAQPSAAPSVEKSAGFSKQPPTHPPVQPSPQPVQSEKKLPPQPQPPAPPLQPPTLPPAQPPVPTQAHPAHPAVPLNSMWADHKPSVNLDFAGPSSQTAMQEDSTAMALPPPPSIPPPPAPCGNMAGVKPKAISPAPASEMDPSMRNIQRPPPGIDLGLLLTGPAPGLSPQPVLPPPGIAKPFPNDSTSLAPAEAAAVSAVQGLGTDSFFGGAPGLDFGGLNGLGAIGFPPGISPKQPHGHRLLQRPGSIPGMPGNSMPEEFYPQTMPDTSNRLGMFQEAPPASSSLFSSPFGMFGPIGSHSYGDGNPDGNDFLSDLRSDSRRMDK